MDNIRNKIVEEFYTSHQTKISMKGIPKAHKEELLSFISLFLLEMDINKLEELYNNNELNRFVYGIIQNQYWKGKKKTKKRGQSNFWKEKSVIKIGKPLGDGDKVDIENLDIPDSEFDLKDYYLNKIDNDLRLILDRYYYKNLSSIYYFFNRQVFELYYYERMTMKDIAKATKIGYETIRCSIRDTLRFIKEELEKNK